MNSQIEHEAFPCKFENGQTVSQPCELGRHTIVGFLIPADFEGVTLTIAAKVKGEDYMNVYDANGQAISLTVAASRFVTVPPAAYASLQNIKLTSNAAVTADRTVLVIARPAA